MRTLFQIFITILFILALNDIAKGQTLERVFIVNDKDTLKLINKSQVIVTQEYFGVLLEPVSGKPTKFTITVEEIVTEPVITVVNNTDLTFTGLWEHPSGVTYTVSHSSQVGATAKYTFTGNRIEVISDLAPGHGVLEYIINSGSPKSVNLYAATRLNSQIVINETVPSGENTITFKVVSGTVLIDFLRITK